MAKSFVGAGGMRFAAPDGGTEPIGDRIIVLPKDETEAKLRDPHSGFIDYVPTGSIAQRPSAGHDRRRRQDRRLRALPRAGSQRHGRGAAASSAGPRPTYSASSTTSRAAPATARGVAFMKPRRRQPDAERHDRARGLSGVAQSVMTGFTNLGDLIPARVAICRRSRSSISAANRGPRDFTFAQLDAMANGVARALAQARIEARRPRRDAVRQPRRIYRGLLRHHARRLGRGAGEFQVPARDHPFHHPRCRREVRLLRCAARGGLSARHRRRDVRRRVRCVSRSRPVRRGHAGAGRAGDVPLHVRIDRHAEGRGAVAPQPHLGGGDAARATGSIATAI